MNTNHLSTLYRSQSKADLQFRKIIENTNDVLQTKEDINLTFPVNIVEKGHDAFWDYSSIQPRHVDRDYSDEEEDEEYSYLFHKIYVGLTVTTEKFSDYGNVSTFLTVYIGAKDGEREVELFQYSLDDDLNLEKITGDIAATVAIIRDFEISISNMTPEKSKTAQHLLNILLDRGDQ